MPKLSILVPTYNRRHFLQQCLDSLLATKVDAEIIVSDNGSTDGTDTLLQNYIDPRIRYFRHPENRGVFFNFDFSFQQATGEYVNIFGDDDVVLPNAFLEEIAILEQNPEIAFAYCAFDYINEKNELRGIAEFISKMQAKHSYLRGNYEFDDLLTLSCIQHQTVVFRRSMLAQSGGFSFSLDRPEIIAARDWFMMQRMVFDHTIAHISDRNVRVRIHSTNYSNDARKKGDFLIDRFSLITHWLLVHEPAPVLDPTTWNVLFEMTAIDIVRVFGNNQEQIAKYIRKLLSIQARYAQRMERAARKSMGKTRRMLPLVENHATVVSIAPIFELNGRSRSAIAFCDQLLDNDISVSARAIGKSAPENLTHFTKTTITSRVNFDSCIDAIQVYFTRPGAFSANDNVYQIGRVLHETDRIPTSWVTLCNQMDELWAATSFTEQLLHQSGIHVPIFVIPESVDPTVFYPSDDVLDVAGANGFIFLSVLDWTDKHGWDLLLEAWAYAFKPNDPVTLVLLTRNSESVDLGASISQLLTTRLNKSTDDIANIVILTETLQDNDLARLYRTANVYVSAARGTTWGHCIVEAMACKKTVIAPRWGNILEYLNDNNAFLVNIESLEKVGPNNPSALRGQQWAKPAILHFAEQLRAAFENSQLLQQRASQAFSDVERYYSVNVFHRIEERIRSIELNMFTSHLKIDETALMGV